MSESTEDVDVVVNHDLKPVRIQTFEKDGGAYIFFKQDKVGIFVSARSLVEFMRAIQKAHRMLSASAAKGTA